MLKLLASFFISLLLMSSAFAEDINQSDKAAVQQVIGGQLEAFKAEDGAMAYSFAAPIVTKAFPTVEKFMAMVKGGYQPILQNRKYTFGKAKIDTLGRPAQHVTITAADGKRYEAVYAMQKQADGSWKIAGVQMVEIPGLEV